MFVLFALWGCSGSGISANLGFGSGNTARTCSTVDRGEEGAFTWFGTWGERLPCSGVAHAVGGAEGTRFRVTLSYWSEGTARLDLRNWNDDVLFTRSGLQLGDSAEFTMPYGGEALLELLPEATEDDGGDYGFELECLSNCSANWSKYPFYLMHGFASSGDTFERAVEIFDDAGYRVYAPSVSRFDTSIVRGSEVMQEILADRADGSFRGVHLIGHSMGGMDARFIASQIDPDRLVKTITTLSTPHDGTPVADIALDLIDNDYTPREKGRMMDALAPDGGATSADGTINFGTFGLTDQLYQLSRPGAAFFNTQNPDRSDVEYRSWTGMTCGKFQFGCQWDFGWETVSLLLTPTHAVFRYQGLPSDGVVDVYSGIYGNFQGILAADHNEMSGGKFWSWPSFDDDAFFQREAYRLADWEHGFAPISEPEAYTLAYLEANY